VYGRAYSPSGFGVALIQSTIDATRAGAPSGAIEVRGQGGTWPGGDGVLGPIPAGNGQMGIWSYGASLAGGQVLLDGRGGYGDGSDPGVVRGGSGVVLANATQVSASPGCRSTVVAGRRCQTTSNRGSQATASSCTTTRRSLRRRFAWTVSVAMSSEVSPVGRGRCGRAPGRQRRRRRRDARRYRRRGSESGPDGTGGRGVSINTSSGGEVSGSSISVQGTGGLGNASPSGTGGTGGIGAYIEGFLQPTGALAITGTGGRGSSGANGTGGQGVRLVGDSPPVRPR